MMAPSKSTGQRRSIVWTSCCLLGCQNLYEPSFKALVTTEGLGSRFENVYNEKNAIITELPSVRLGQGRSQGVPDEEARLRVEADQHT